MHTALALPFAVLVSASLFAAIPRIGAQPQDICATALSGAHG